MAKTMLERLLTKCKMDLGGGCWNWTAAKNKAGYGQVNVDGKIKYAHRVSYEVFYATSPGSLCVCHKCDNTSCINPDHLYLGTVADNIADMVAKGRQNLGTKNGKVKLTEKQVLEIRASPDKRKILASKYGVSPQQITHIRTRKQWAHI